MRVLNLDTSYFDSLHIDQLRHYVLLKVIIADAVNIRSLFMLPSNARAFFVIFVLITR